MMGLICKDLISNKRIIIPTLLVVGFFVVVMLIFPLSDLVFDNEKPNDWELGLGFLMCCVNIFFILQFFEEGSNRNDEMKRWQYFIASAEDGIKKQVGSKYIICFLFTTVTFSTLNVTGSISSAALGVDISIFQTLGMQFIWLQLFLVSIEMPFMFAFGVKKGEKIRMIVIGGFTFAAIFYLCFGDLSIFGDPVKFVLWLREFAKDSGNYFLLLTPPVTLILYYISYRISCGLYLKGGEHFDR